MKRIYDSKSAKRRVKTAYLLCNEIHKYGLTDDRHDRLTKEIESLREINYTKEYRELLSSIDKVYSMQK